MMFTVEVTPQDAEAKCAVGFDVEKLSQEQVDALRTRLGLGEQGAEEKAPFSIEGITPEQVEALKAKLGLGNEGSSDGIHTPVGTDDDPKSVVEVARDYYWETRDLVRYLGFHGIEDFDPSEYGWVRALSKVIEHLNRRIIALENQAGIPTPNPYDREYR